MSSVVAQLVEILLKIFFSLGGSTKRSDSDAAGGFGDGIKAAIALFAEMSLRGRTFKFCRDKKGLLYVKTTSDSGEDTYTLLNCFAADYNTRYLDDPKEVDVATMWAAALFAFREAMQNFVDNTRKRQAEDKHTVFSILSHGGWMIRFLTVEGLYDVMYYTGMAPKDQVDKVIEENALRGSCERNSVAVVLDILAEPAMSMHGFEPAVIYQYATQLNAQAADILLQVTETLPFYAAYTQADYHEDGAKVQDVDAKSLDTDKRSWIRSPSSTCIFFVCRVSWRILVPNDLRILNRYAFFPGGLFRMPPDRMTRERTSQLDCGFLLHMAPYIWPLSEFAEDLFCDCKRGEPISGEIVDLLGQFPSAIRTGGVGDFSLVREMVAVALDVIGKEHPVIGTWVHERLYDTTVIDQRVYDFLKVAKAYAYDHNTPAPTGLSTLADYVKIEWIPETYDEMCARIAEETNVSLYQVQIQMPDAGELIAKNLENMTNQLRKLLDDVSDEAKQTMKDEIGYFLEFDPKKELSNGVYAHDRSGHTNPASMTTGVHITVTSHNWTYTSKLVEVCCKRVNNSLPWGFDDLMKFCEMQAVLRDTQMKQDGRHIDAAIVIQRHFRLYKKLARRGANESPKYDAAVVIQSCARASILAGAFRKKQESVSKSDSDETSDSESDSGETSDSETGSGETSDSESDSDDGTSPNMSPSRKRRGYHKGKRYQKGKRCQKGKRRETKEATNHLRCTDGVSFGDFKRPPDMSHRGAAPEHGQSWGGWREDGIPVPQMVETTVKWDKPSEIPYMGAEARDSVYRAFSLTASYENHGGRDGTMKLPTPCPPGQVVDFSAKLKCNGISLEDEEIRRTFKLFQCKGCGLMVVYTGNRSIKFTLTIRGHSLQTAQAPMIQHVLGIESAERALVWRALPSPDEAYDGDHGDVQRLWCGQRCFLFKQNLPLNLGCEIVVVRYPGQTVRHALLWFPDSGLLLDLGPSTVTAELHMPLSPLCAEVSSFLENASDEDGRALLDKVASLKRIHYAVYNATYHELRRYHDECVRDQPPKRQKR